MTRIACVIQARMGSTRLPGKVLMDLAGRPVLRWVWDACYRSAGIDELVVATSTSPQDDAIYDYCGRAGMRCIRGDEEDVIARFMNVFEALEFPDAMVRITADEPFLDSSVLEAVIGAFRQQWEFVAAGELYVSNVHPRTYPDGLDVEAFSSGALLLANDLAKRSIDRECVTSWMVRNPDLVGRFNVYNHLEGMKNERWVLDAKEDYEFCQMMAEIIVAENVIPTQASMLDILDFFPGYRAINAHLGINERFLDALDEEPLAARRDLEGFLVAGSNSEIVDTIDKLIELRIEEYVRKRDGSFR